MSYQYMKYKENRTIYTRPTTRNPGTTNRSMQQTKQHFCLKQIDFKQYPI